MDPERFVEAQAAVYGRVCDELRHGEKRSHWMWFVFSHIAGLGHSEMARRYALASLDEARAYLEHPLLGARLRECVELLNGLQGRRIEQVMGYPDDLKLRSSLTLFARACSENQIFLDALKKFHEGELDAETLKRLKLVRVFSANPLDRET